MEAPALGGLPLGASPQASCPSSASSSTSSSASSSSSSSFRCSNARAAAPPTADEDAYRRHRQRRKHSASSERRHSSSGGSGSSRRHSSSGGSGSALDLPLDREFLPLPLDQDEEERRACAGPADGEAAARDQVRHDVLCMLFGLPHATAFFQDFSCAIAASLAMHGRMYPTSTHVCFYSNVFGRERKILIPYESISELAKTTTMVFQNAIRIRTTDGKEDYTFASFWGNNRDNCFDLIAKTREHLLKELRPTVVHSFKRITGGSPTAQTFINGDHDHALPSDADAESANASPQNDVAAAGEVAQPSAEAPLADVDASEASDSAPRISEDSGEASEEKARPLRQRQRSVVSDVERIAPKDISMTLVLEETFPVSVDEFMAVFLLDNAPFGMDKYGELTGATEMTVNPWMTPLEEEKSFGMTRSQQFRVPIEAPIGPKSSRVDVLQCLKEERNVRVVETSTRLADIPYGDYFSVEDRWTIVPHADDPNACQVKIELKVVFGKSTFWKSTIEGRAISDNKEKWKKWVVMAKEFLEKRKQQAAAACNDGETSAAAGQQETETRCQSGSHNSPDDSAAVSVSRRRSGRAMSVDQDRRRSSQLHRSNSRAKAAGVVSMRNRNVPVKVFPWILVLVLLFIVVRLQATLSTIETSLELTSRRVLEIQEQLAQLQAAACPAQ